MSRAKGTETGTILRESDRAFFQPLWRRVAVTAVCVVWAGIEFANGETFWGFLIGAAAAYAGWNFFIAWKDGPKPE